MPTYPAYCPVGIDGHDYDITCGFLSTGSIERPNGRRAFALCDRHNLPGAIAKRTIGGQEVRGVVHDGIFTAAPFFGILRVPA